MKTPQNIQPSFNDEISIADIIHFLKSHKKMILIFVIIGALLGGLYANFTEPIYKGSVLISSAKVSGVYVVNPKITLTKVNINSFYSKETLLNCNPDFYKEKEKDINYDISRLIKASLTTDGELIQLKMQNKNKTVIKDCLNSMVHDISLSQNKIADSLIQSKNNELKFEEEKLKDAEELRNKLNNRQIKDLKTTNERIPVDLLYTDIIFSVFTINKIKTELASEQTKTATNVLPISIEKKSFPSPKLGALMGLFLGLCLGILIALIKQMKI